MFPTTALAAVTMATPDCPSVGGHPIPIGIERRTMYLKTHYQMHRFSACLLVIFFWAIVDVACIQQRQYQALKSHVGVLQSDGTSPFNSAEFVRFINKFNIPKNHGSGVFVDLGNVKLVNGKEYREVAGKCPVFGKFIQTYQPNRARYPNNFLADVPTQQEATITGSPLPGGFNNIFYRPNGSRMSPMTLAVLQSFSGLSAKTPLGKCAQYSYFTTAKNSDNSSTDYRYPFVWDSKNNLCYYLYVSMQRLKGDRYCSTDGQPNGLTWYCFEPKKDPLLQNHLVYGSSYVGQNPDEWEANCPSRGVTDATFGVWENGACTDHATDPSSIIHDVTSKEQCWQLAFNNADVASDHPASSLEAGGTLEHLFPTPSPNQPVSGGIGRNYANFVKDTTSGKTTCALSDRVPTCFVPKSGAVAYTSLSSLEEEPLPTCNSITQPTFSSCDSSSCTRTMLTCNAGLLTGAIVECDGGCLNLGLIIGLSVLGLILLILLIAGIIYYYKKKHPRGTASTKQSAGTKARSSGRPAAGRPSGNSGDARESIADMQEYMQDQHQIQRPPQRRSDLLQQAEPSFWDETEADHSQPRVTDVLVEDY